MLFICTSRLILARTSRNQKGYCSRGVAEYAEMMAGFVHQPDIPKLFAGYWELYISQLPEAIFQQVNENFYRTTYLI
jgi:hypothetical protein